MAAWIGDCVGSTTNTSDVATIRGITCIIERLLEAIPAILVLGAVGVIIFGGIKLLTAGSDPKAIESAWKTITWAAVGIVLMAVAWLILVAIENLTGAPVTQFGFD